jgi:hypothetical protein
MPPEQVCLGVILLIILIFIVYFITAGNGSHKSYFFSPTTNATPKAISAASNLFTTLEEVSYLAHIIEVNADDNEIVVSVKNNVNTLLRYIDPLCSNFSTIEPTFANYSDIYNVFASMDYRPAADSYLMAASTIGDNNLGVALNALGNKLYQFQKSVHRLGVALNYE